MRVPALKAADSETDSLNSSTLLGGGAGRVRGVTKLLLQGAVCLAPFVFICSVVLRYAVNVPISDDWELVVLLEKDRSGSLSFADLWAQHNEHRLVLPQLVMLLLARLTMWDIRYQLIISLACALATYAVVCLLLIRTLRGYLRGWTLVALAVASVIMFSPVRSDDWLWGWQVQWFMIVLGLLLAVGVLELWPESRPAWQAVALAALASVFGLYSLSSGALIWGAGLVVVLLRPRYRRFWVLWLLAAVATVGTYLIGYQAPAHHPPIAYFFEHPGESVRYVAFYLGRPFSSDQDAGIVAGLVIAGSFVGLVAFVLLSGRWRLAGVAGWIAIGCFAAGSAAITAVARVGFGIQQAGSSRYTHVSVLFLISTLALAAVAVTSREGSNYAAWRVSLAMLAWMLAGSLLLFDYPAQIREIESHHEFRMKGLKCVTTVTSSNDPCLAAIYPNAETAYELTEVLRENQLGPFAVSSGEAGKQQGG